MEKPEGGSSPVRRVPRPVTAAYLDRAALAYLERFAATAESLRRVLARKVALRCRARGEEAETYLPLVEETVAKCLRTGLVDDRRFAEARLATLRRRGGSARAIRAKLAAKGVDRALAAEILHGEAEDAAAAELGAAHALARRRRLGPYGREDRAASRERDLAALARAGFPFEVAREVVDGEGEEPVP